MASLLTILDLRLHLAASTIRSATDMQRLLEKLPLLLVHCNQLRAQIDSAERFQAYVIVVLANLSLPPVYPAKAPRL